MPDEMVKSVSTHQNKQKKIVVKEATDLADAWKFGSFTIRALVASATGKVFGNSAVDEAMGEALASIYPPQEACDKGTHYSILIHGMAGAWKAARGEQKWE